MTPCRIAIIGTGVLGVHLAERIIERNICDVLHLANRSAARLAGVVKSLQVFSHVVGSKVRVESWPCSRVKGVDLVVIAIKDDYDPRDLLRNETLPMWLTKDVRTVGLRRDLPLIREVCHKLADFHGKVAVISNPVDILTTLVSDWLPNSRVLGFGVTLDAARLAFTMSETLKRQITKWECPVGGEHGRNLIPFRSVWEPSLVAQLSSQNIKRQLEKSSMIGPQIVASLGFTVHDCAAVFCDDIEWLIGSTRPRPPKTSYFSLNDGNGAIGVPVALSSTDCISQTEILSDKECLQIQEARKQVSEVVNRIQRCGWCDLAEGLRK